MNNKVTAALPLAFALLGGTLLTNTGTEQHRVRLAYHTVFKPAAAALSPADQAVAEENCPFGLPQKDPGCGSARRLSSRARATLSSTALSTRFRSGFASTSKKANSPAA